MPADFEIAVTFDTDQAVSDLEDELEDADIEAPVSSQTDGGTGGGGDEGSSGLLAAEAGSDIAGGGDEGGILGSLAGGISRTVGLLAGIVGFLALLEPIQQALGFILRQFELFVVPVIAALQPVLELLQKAAVGLIQIFRDPAGFISGLFNTVKNALAPFANAVINAINTVPGISVSPIERSTRDTSSGQRSAGEIGGAAGATGDIAAGSFFQAGGNFGALGAGALTQFLLSDDAAVEKLRQQVFGGDNIND